MVLPQFTFQIFSIEKNLFKNITNSEHLKDCLNFEKQILAVYHANTIVFSESPRSTVYNAITCEFHSVAQDLKVPWYYHRTPSSYHDSAVAGGLCDKCTKSVSCFEFCDQTLTSRHTFSWKLFVVQHEAFMSSCCAAVICQIMQGEGALCELTDANRRRQKLNCHFGINAENCIYLWKM